MQSLKDEIRLFCAASGIRLKKGLGQNFLVDQDILDQIINAAQIEPGDHIVEIGPGIGVLTRELLKRSDHVTAIELDKRLAQLLLIFTTKIPSPTGRGLGWGQNTQQTNHLEIRNENALHTTYPDHPYKVVANIPYHITSPLLRKLFLESSPPPTSMTLLIQREVAEKICDKKNAGLLTILVGLFGSPQIITLVPPKSFLPPPKVDSAVLHIDCFAEPIADRATIEEVFTLVKLAFSQKRKMLRKTIGAFRGGAERLSAAGIDEKRRPQTLSVAEWIALAQTT